MSGRKMENPSQENLASPREKKVPKIYNISGSPMNAWQDYPSVRPTGSTHHPCAQGFQTVPGTKQAKSNQSFKEIL